MSTPFKLKSGNKPKINIKKLFEYSPIGRIVKKAKKAYKTYKSQK